MFFKKKTNAGVTYELNQLVTGLTEDFEILYAPPSKSHWYSGGDALPSKNVRMPVIAFNRDNKKIYYQQVCCDIDDYSSHLEDGKEIWSPEEVSRKEMHEYLIEWDTPWAIRKEIDAKIDLLKKKKGTKNGM